MGNDAPQTEVCPIGALLCKLEDPSSHTADGSTIGGVKDDIILVEWPI